MVCYKGKSRYHIPCPFTGCKREEFSLVSKSDWFYMSTLYDWSNRVTFHPIRCKTKTNRVSYMYLLCVLIGSLYCLSPFWLAGVITVSIKNCSNKVNVGLVLRTISWKLVGKKTFNKGFQGSTEVGSKWSQFGKKFLTQRKFRVPASWHSAFRFTRL